MLLMLLCDQVALLFVLPGLRLREAGCKESVAPQQLPQQQQQGGVGTDVAGAAGDQNRQSSLT